MEAPAFSCLRGSEADLSAQAKEAISKVEASGLGLIFSKTQLSIAFSVIFLLLFSAPAPALALRTQLHGVLMRWQLRG